MSDAATMRARAGDLAHGAGRRLPGDSGVWVLFFGDMGLFLVFFVFYLVERAGDRDVFAASSAAMDPTIGFTNTLVLLTSSLLVVVGVGAVRAERPGIATPAFGGAVACGIVFVALKFTEYAHLFVSGHGIGANLYYNYYFTLTGIHLIHVLVGIGLLVLLLAKARAQQPLERRLVVIESGACFWHLVDLLWMVIFPLLYLVV